MIQSKKPKNLLHRKSVILEKESLLFKKKTINFIRCITCNFLYSKKKKFSIYKFFGFEFDIVYVARFCNFIFNNIMFLKSSIDSLFQYQKSSNSAKYLSFDCVKQNNNSTLYVPITLL